MVGLGKNSQATLLSTLFLDKFDTSFKLTLKTCFYRMYTYEFNLLWLLNHSNRTSNEEVIDKTMLGSLASQPSLAGKKMHFSSSIFLGIFL